MLTSYRVSVSYRPVPLFAAKLSVLDFFIMHFLGLGGGPRRSNDQLCSVDFWKNELSKAVQEKNQYLEQYAAASVHAEATRSMLMDPECFE